MTTANRATITPYDNEGTDTWYYGPDDYGTYSWDDEGRVISNARVTDVMGHAEWSGTGTWYGYTWSYSGEVDYHNNYGATPNGQHSHYVAQTRDEWQQEQAYLGDIYFSQMSERMHNNVLTDKHVGASGSYSDIMFVDGEYYTFETKYTYNRNEHVYNNTAIYTDYDGEVYKWHYNSEANAAMLMA